MLNPACLIVAAPAFLCSPTPGTYTALTCVLAVLPAHIAGNAAQLAYDATVDRDLVVLASDAASLPEPPPLSPRQAQERADDIVCKMSALMSRSLRIDEATAKFYLKDAGGDLKAAIRCACLMMTSGGRVCVHPRTHSVQRCADCDEKRGNALQVGGG